MSLPWERRYDDSDEEKFHFVETEPTSSLAYEPTTTQPPPVQPTLPIDLDLSAIVASAAQGALKDALPQLQKTVVDYARDTVLGKLQGKEFSTWPTISSGDQIIADAKSRSLRTFWQGLSFDLVMALIGVLSLLSTMNIFDRTAWITFGALLLKTIVQTAISYVMRLKITPQAVIHGEPVKLLTTAVPK